MIVNLSTRLKELRQSKNLRQEQVAKLIYVDKSTISAYENNIRQPLNLDLWEFYVVPTYKINQMAIANNNPNQKTISLNVVRKLAGKPCHYDALRSVIDLALTDVDQYFGCNQKE